MLQFRTIVFISLIAFLIFTSCKKSAIPVAVIKPVVVTPKDTTSKGPFVYTLVWSDEFNGSNIDPTKWSFETGTGVNGDFGTGQLDRATDRLDNATIANNVPNADGGCLAIITRSETYLDRNYTSARLSSSGKEAWGPGYRIEARIWAKDVQYKGQGFAFWMMPSEKPSNVDAIMWPQGGEIDIMEYVGAIPAYNLGSVHYAWFWENNQYLDWNHGHEGAYYSFKDKQVPYSNPGYGGYPPAVGDTTAGSAGFHVYGINWFTDRMEFSIDTIVYHIHYFNDGAAFGNGADGQDQTGNEMINGINVFKSEYSNHFAEWWPFEHNFFILLTAGVGGNDNLTYGGAITPDAIFPCYTYIDWVRVYRRQ